MHRNTITNSPFNVNYEIALNACTVRSQTNFASSEQLMTSFWWCCDTFDAVDFGNILLQYYIIGVSNFTRGCSNINYTRWVKVILSRVVWFVIPQWKQPENLLMLHELQTIRLLFYCSHCCNTGWLYYKLINASVTLTCSEVLLLSIIDWNGFRICMFMSMIISLK